METKESRNHGYLRSVARLTLFLVVVSGSVAWALTADSSGFHGDVEPSAQRSAQASTQSSNRTIPPLFGAIQVNEPDHDRWAAAIRDAGLDSVQVTLYARQQAWDGAEMFWDREAPWVVSEIRAARRAGLRVSLVMRVALEHGLEANRHLWHGMIWPRDDQVDAWFERYGEFLAWGAQIAADEAVDMFAVANEMSSMTSTSPVDELPDLYAYYGDPDRTAAVDAELVRCADRRRATGEAADLIELDGGRYADLASMLADAAARRREWVGIVAPSVSQLNARRARHERGWRELIERVRRIYHGPLAYGANFDQFEEVGFWDALDVAGVNAYFPLSRYGAGDTVRAERMRERWSDIAAELGGLGKPVVLMELGWTRKRGATVRPYSYDRIEVLETEGQAGLTCVHWASQPDDPFERVAAIESLAAVVEGGGFPQLRGLTLWKLTTNPEHRAIEPFVAVLGAPADGAAVDRADSRYLQAAARVRAAVLEGS